mmetsp:Transcript_2596/g.4807  ORF Transcript_2596/g.4807 Transcript_2596/m.4807 type:complete len:241 (+) Transcript_2596:391-1113(+)
MLRRCTNLERLAFIRTDGVDQHLQELVSSIREDANQIETLALDGIAGNVGREALVSLLQDRNSNIHTLRLGMMNNVDKDNTTLLVNALAKNNKLNRLFLVGNIGIDDFDWEALSRTLCNTSSINATYYSNHTLNSLGGALSARSIPSDIYTLLDMNRSCNDKKQTAIQKVLHFHPHFDMKPFFEWDLKVLPHVVDWFGRNRAYTENIEADIDARKVDAIYQFIHAMPELFEPTPAGSKMK